MGSVYMFVNVARETRTIISWRGCCVTRPAPWCFSLLFSRGIKCFRFPAAAAAAEEKRATRSARRASRGNERQTADGGTSSRSNYHLFVSAAIASIDFSLHRIPGKTKKNIVHINNAIRVLYHIPTPAAVKAHIKITSGKQRVGCTKASVFVP